jgi:hypothetical protein
MNDPRRRDIDRRQLAVRSGWSDPSQRLSSDVDAAVKFYEANRRRVLTMNDRFDRFMDTLQDVRQLAFWMFDPDAALSFELFCQTLQREQEDVARAIFKGASDDLVKMFSNRNFICPVCLQKKGQQT